MPKSGLKILRKMRQSLAGWSQDDINAVYAAHGFIMREGGSHVIWVHPKYPDLRAAVGRHRHLDKAYAAKAIELVDKLAALEALAEKGEAAE